MMTDILASHSTGSLERISGEMVLGNRAALSEGNWLGVMMSNLGGSFTLYLIVSIK